MKTCNDTNCNSVYYAKGYCELHYSRMRRFGYTSIPPGSKLYKDENQDMRNFSHKVEITESCWIWRGARTGSGYGAILCNGRTIGAHVFSYKYFIGQYESRMVLDHLCEVRHCVNPFHLEPVTQRENVIRSFQNRLAYDIEKTCPNGHVKNDDNFSIRTGQKYTGYCRLCTRERQRSRKSIE